MEETDDEKKELEDAKKSNEKLCKLIKEVLENNIERLLLVIDCQIHHVYLLLVNMGGLLIWNVL